MAQFLFLVSPERPAAGALSPAGLGRRAQAFTDWLDTLRREDRLTAGALLGSSSERLSLDLRGMIADADEIKGAPIRLLFCVEAVNMQAAKKIALDCPSALPGTIDVFEIESLIGRRRFSLSEAQP